jgi:hypothetical protein
MDHCIAYETGLSASNANQEARKQREKSSENNNNGVGDFYFAYKLFSPFVFFAGAFVCTIWGYEIQARKNSTFGVFLGFAGPIGLLLGLLLWVIL